MLVVNLGLDGHTNAIISGRIQAVFGGGACACVSTPVDANILVFATTNAAALDAVQLRARGAALDGRRLLPYPLAPLAEQLGRCR